MDSTLLKNWKIRLKLESTIRSHFNALEYLEVKTPLLVPSGGIDGHIKPIKVEEAFLPTSPELGMKKLLARGIGPIYQICSSFRDEPVSNLHLPEFSMLEWYRPHCDYHQLMSDVESLFESILHDFDKGEQIIFQGKAINFKTPWPRLRIRELFKEKTGILLDYSGDRPNSRCYDTLKSYCKKKHSIRSNTTTYSWDDLFHLIWLNEIEPFLPSDRPAFILDYPVWQRSLSQAGRDESGMFAKRFEVFMGGLELGNAFDESLDWRDYQNQVMYETSRSPHNVNHPLDEELLLALKKEIPPTAGIAMGVDRMVMLLADTLDIRSTVLLEPFLRKE